MLEVHGERMLKDNYKPGFRTRLYQKDLRLANEAASANGVAIPATAVVTQLLNALVASGGADLDYAALGTVLFKMAGAHRVGRNRTAAPRSGNRRGGAPRVNEYRLQLEADMNARRDFLRQVVPAGLVGVAALKTDWLARIAPPPRRSRIGRRPSFAADEGYWREIQQAFTLDRTIINLNNGYTCPSPRVVHEALKRYLDISNQAPIHFMWNQLEPNVETSGASSRPKSAATPRSSPSRATPARGCRSPSSASTCKAGDEVVTTNQDYGRMLDTWDQRVRRDKITVNKISFPVPTTTCPS